MMRPIDGDALRDKLQNLGYDDWNQGVTTTWAEAFYACADIVAEAPTIEPERKTGKWIVVDDGIISGKCSVCGWEAHMYEDDVMGMDYCPNCGARLEGEG